MRPNISVSLYIMQQSKHVAHVRINGRWYGTYQDYILGELKKSILKELKRSSYGQHFG